MAEIEKYQELLRQAEEKQEAINHLKNEVFQKAIEICKLQQRLDEMEKK